MRFERDAAPGVHRVEDSRVNWYLVEGDEGLTVVDAGIPASWHSLYGALDAIGRTTADIRAVVLTHGHFDHVGFAERAREELRVPVWAPEGDVPLTQHPLRYPCERLPLLYVRRPSFLRNFGGFIAGGALGTPRVREVRPYRDGDELPVPGRPRAVATPGHTPGHMALHLADRDVLLAGDAVVMLDPYTGWAGPRLVSKAATADTAQARASLDRLRETGARHVLTGHGPAWHDGAAAMADAAGVAEQG